LDLNKNAFRIVESLTTDKKENKRSKAASKAGKQGGPARAKVLTREQRIEIARKANLARWAHKNGNGKQSQ
jgi:hypothetical protein